MTELPLDSKRITKATFLERPNRFLVKCRSDRLGVISAFLPNPGRLWELLLPGAELYLYPAPSGREALHGTRKTSYTILAVQMGNYPVFLHTHMTNQAFKYLLERDLIPSMEGWRIVKEEVFHGRNRFDFLLQGNKKEFYVEVKSCTLFGNRLAMFPDAVTERGRRHLMGLADIGRKGIGSVMVFMVHYPGAIWFMPDFHTDYDFSTAMLNARNDIKFLPLSVQWRPDLTIGPKVNILPVPWEYLKAEVHDRGSYILLLALTEGRFIEVGKLGRIMFPKGHYLYVGSAMLNLRARINRHIRKTKRLRWHIDYLAKEADSLIPIPIRSSNRQECEIAGSLSLIMREGAHNFGSSDCDCPTHLFWSEENPIHRKDFHDIIHKFRMRHPEKN